ncbi:MAG: 4-hydroxy-tetrahydrodipicolinate reductase [Acidobacteria bacterium]|nr:4-hydroxy-tetrahydrodipicolinate reductase [Acidobacteriota bacterium]
MRILVLGAGKTGKLVAEVAAQHGHSINVLDAKENKDAAALTAPFVAGFDVVIDFTTPEAVVSNMRACLAVGAKMVIGTTGWHHKLPDMRALADRRGASLLYGTNFSIGMQLMLSLSKTMAAALKDAGYTFSIEETHHTSKLDVPSGTALTLRDAALSTVGPNNIGEGNQIVIHANRTGDVQGIHSLVATSSCDRIILTHESLSRKPFAEGAVRAAEWLSSQRSGVYDFHDIYTKL